MVDLQAVASVIQSIQVSEVLVRVRCEHADERAALERSRRSPDERILVVMDDPVLARDARSAGGTRVVETDGDGGSLPLARARNLGAQEALARGAHNEIKFSNEGRASILKGVDVLADAVSVTLGPKGEYATLALRSTR